MQDCIFVFECGDPDRLGGLISDILIDECLASAGNFITTEIKLDRDPANKKFIMQFTSDALYCTFPFVAEDVGQMLEECYNFLHDADQLELRFRAASITQNKIIVQFHNDKHPLLVN